MRVYEIILCLFTDSKLKISSEMQFETLCRNFKNYFSEYWTLL